MKFAIAIILAVLAPLASVAQAGSDSRPAITTNAFVEASRDFLKSDFGAINKHSLETNTLPKKVALTALVLEGRRKGWIKASSIDYKTVLARFGFFTPSIVMNAPAELKPKWGDLPMGLTEAEVKMGFGIRVEGMNVTCAVCHASRLYDEKGHATTEAWMGLPNTSINLEGYSQAVFQGMRILSNNTDDSFSLMKNMFPEMGFKEKATMKLLVLPRVEKTIRKMEDLYKQALPFSNGSPGNTNGVAALKFQMGMLDTSKVQPEYGFTSIPTLGDRYFRSSFLWDGVYAAPNSQRNVERSSWNEQDENFLNTVAAIFTIPTMGQSIEGALENIPRIKKSLNVIFAKYEAPSFPGEVDFERARRGYEVYQNSCSQCHGTYTWSEQSRPKLVSFPNRMIPQERMETDPTRWQAVTPELANSFNKTALGKSAVLERSAGYVAPLLNSLWATAPYLHNGSVPTLWDLMHPEDRPTKFLVGGHDLDYAKMGIKLVVNPAWGVSEYPREVTTHSVPVIYDTSLPGQSNAGHTRPFAKLSEDQKSELLEYLKLL